MKRYIKASNYYASVADMNFLEYGFLVADESSSYESGVYSFLSCQPFPEEDNLYLFSRGTVYINDDYIDADRVSSYAGVDKESDPEQFVEAIVSYYGADFLGGESYSLTRYEVLKELSGYSLPDNINFDGYSYRDAFIVFGEEELKKDYLERALGQIDATVTYNFNTLKEMINDEEDLVLVDGLYFPRKAVKWVETADSYQDFHLNKNMDMTVANILSAVEDFDSPEDYIKDLFEDYRPDSALSWTNNFTEVLRHMSSEDKWDDGNYDYEHYMGEE